MRDVDLPFTYAKFGISEEQPFGDIITVSTNNEFCSVDIEVTSNKGEEDEKTNKITIYCGGTLDRFIDILKLASEIHKLKPVIK